VGIPNSFKPRTKDCLSKQKKSSKQATGVNKDRGSLKQAAGVKAGRRKGGSKGDEMAVRGESKKRKEMDFMKRSDSDGARMADPWVVGPADVRPNVITHREPSDEPREPAREL
jgi:hypothetical protein